MSKRQQVPCGHTCRKKHKDRSITDLFQNAEACQSDPSSSSCVCWMLKPVTGLVCICQMLVTMSSKPGVAMCLTLCQTPKPVTLVPLCWTVMATSSKPRMMTCLLKSSCPSLRLMLDLCLYLELPTHEVSWMLVIWWRHQWQVRSWSQL